MFSSLSVPGKALPVFACEVTPTWYHAYNLCDDYCAMSGSGTHELSCSLMIAYCSLIVIMIITLFKVYKVIF